MRSKNRKSSPFDIARDVFNGPLLTRLQRKADNAMIPWTPAEIRRDLWRMDRQVWSLLLVEVLRKAPRRKR